MWSSPCLRDFLAFGSVLLNTSPLSPFKPSCNNTRRSISCTLFVIMADGLERLISFLRAQWHSIAPRSQPGLTLTITEWCPVFGESHLPQILILLYCKPLVVKLIDPCPRVFTSIPSLKCLNLRDFNLVWQLQFADNTIFWGKQFSHKYHLTFLQASGCDYEINQSRSKGFYENTPPDLQCNFTSNVSWFRARITPSKLLRSYINGVNIVWNKIGLQVSLPHL